jgi:hypothetical protein
MEATETRINKHISKKPKGTIFFPEDFKPYGNDEAVRVALHRMVKKGEIVRMAQGIYTVPKQSELIGAVYPTVDEIAKAIAKRDRARILPTGAFALNALGLSTQIPTKVVYLTDGAPRIVKVGKQTILFKRTTPKNLAVIGKISGLAIQALKSIGKDQITEIETAKIITILKRESLFNLKHDRDLAPAWISEFFDLALKEHRYVN